HSADQTRGHRPSRRVPRRAPGPGEPPPRPHTAAGQVPAAKPLQADARAGARDPCPLGGRRRHPGAARRGIRRPPQARAAHRAWARVEGRGMRIVGTFESRAEWLAARRKGLGASDIAAIAGVSRWSTPWQVYVDKVGAIPLDNNDGATEAMRWGQLLEGLVLDEWERRSGMVAGMRGLMVQHDTHDWALASLDAL